MSGPFGSQQWMYSSGFYTHEIDNSARLDTNSYYTRTPSSAGNLKTWTWSAWVKRGNLGGLQNLFSSDTNIITSQHRVRFNSDNFEFFSWDGTNEYKITTTALFRDVSAWYHVVVVYDTSNATSTDRMRLYVNGNRITDFSTANYPTLNYNGILNNSIAHNIGRWVGSGYPDEYFNGYLAEINFVDGQALDASYFGENKSDVWIPKRYSGSYGTNGFYLDFATRATDPIDASGNSNNWSSVNVASTDWMLDSPTNNFDVLDILQPNANTSGTSFTEGNLKYTNTAGSSNQNVGSRNFPVDSIDWYFEARCNARPAQDQYTYAGINSAYFRADGQVIVNGSTVTTVSGLSVGDILGFAFGPNKGIEIYRNGSSVYTNASHTPNPPPLMNSYSSGSWTFNFGQDSSFAGATTAQGNTDANGIGDFYYSVPSGCLSRCTTNLPDPVAAIDPAQDANPQDHFNTVLYTGNGTGQSITGVGFQPDWVWIKSRSVAANHGLFDVLRVVSGAQEILYSDLTNAGNTGGGYLSSIDSDGFTVNNNTSGNGSGYTYAAWNWKAGGTGVSNTVGEISSTVSANQDLGISIITYTGDTSVSNYNVGTGLSSSAPLAMAIVKRRDSTSEWQVGHSGSPQGANFAYHTELNSTAALSGSGPYFMGTQSSSNGDRLYLSSGANINSATYVAYCFQEVEGFSRFGSYTGNGSTDGPFVYCGFRPAFVMIKRTDSAANWFIFDSVRDTYNVLDHRLIASLSNAEGTGIAYGDFTSNGIKLRTTDTDWNASGGTYIFMAFSEMPFKYANAR